VTSFDGVLVSHFTAVHKTCMSLRAPVWHHVAHVSVLCLLAQVTEVTDSPCVWQLQRTTMAAAHALK
jgi:hypothetical protein